MDRKRASPSFVPASSVALQRLIDEVRGGRDTVWGSTYNRVYHRHNR